MKKTVNFRKIIILVLSLCLLGAAQPVLLQPAFSTSGPLLGFSPSYTLVKEGTSFTVALSLTDCTIFSFFDLIVAYNTSILDALNASISLQWPGFVTVNDEAGTVELYSYSNTTYASGNLTLGEIEFKSITCGNSTLQFLLNDIGIPPNYIDVGVSEGLVEVVSLDLTVATTSRFYYPNQNITVCGNLTVVGTPTEDLVGIEVRTPESQPIAMRVAVAGAVPPPDLWQANITTFYPVDSAYGNPKYIFVAGYQAMFRVTARNLSNETIPVCFAVNLYDKYGGTVGVAVASGIVAANSESSAYPQVFIPPNTVNGTASAIAGIFSAKPSEGGHPYSVERTTSLQILSNVNTYPQISPSNATFQADYNLTFRLPLVSMGIVSMGEFRVYASAMYRGLDVSTQTRFAYINTWVDSIDPKANYTTIQAAINAASGTNAIYVSGGTYEENIVVNKTALTIIGDYDSPTIVDGNLTDNVACITAAYVRLINLLIINSGTTPDHNSGIEISNSLCALMNNTIRDNDRGITIRNSDSTSVLENSIFNNTYGLLVSSGSDSTSVLENSIFNNTYGLSVNNAHYASISGNLIVDNDVGLQIINATYADVSGNQAVGNDQGIVLEGALSNNNSLHNNTVSTNNIGIELHLVTSNSIINNTIMNNTDFGVHVLDANQNEVSGNDFLWNGIQAYSSTANNTFDAGYPAGGNYWSDYSGADMYSGPYQNMTGSDGIGDTPYTFDDDSLDYYPFVYPSYWQDIGIANAFPRTIFPWNYTTQIHLRIINYGSNPQVSNVTLYCNDVLIGQKTATVEGRSFSTQAFSWNFSAVLYGNHTLFASISLFLGEANTTNNQYTQNILVSIPGDVNGDFQVKPHDLNTLLVAFGGKEDGSGQRPYNPNCDINGDGTINARDLNALLVHFGQHYP